MGCRRFGGEAEGDTGWVFSCVVGEPIAISHLYKQERPSDQQTAKNTHHLSTSMLLDCVIILKVCFEGLRRRDALGSDDLVQYTAHGGLPSYHTTSTWELGYSTAHDTVQYDSHPISPGPGMPPRIWPGSSDDRSVGARTGHGCSY